MTETLLQHFLDWLMFYNQGNIFRIKGFVKVAGHPLLTAVQGVNEVVQFNMTTHEADKMENILVIIGRNLDQKEIQNAFEEAMVLTKQKSFN